MTRDDITTRAREIVADILGFPSVDVTLDADFAADLRADDLDRIEIILEVEDAFDIEITDDEAEGLRTVADLVAFLARAIGVREAA